MPGTATTRILPPPPLPVCNCRYCGKDVKDSVQGFLREGRGASGRQIEAPCEAWVSEVWLQTGLEWTKEDGPFWAGLKKMMLKKDMEVVKGIFTVVAALRRRHRHIRRDTSAMGITNEAVIPEGRRQQWRVLAALLTTNPRQRTGKALARDQALRRRKAANASSRANLRKEAIAQSTEARKPARVELPGGFVQRIEWVERVVEKLRASHISPAPRDRRGDWALRLWYDSGIEFGAPVIRR